MPSESRGLPGSLVTVDPSRYRSIAARCRSTKVLAYQIMSAKKCRQKPRLRKRRPRSDKQETCNLSDLRLKHDPSPHWHCGGFQVVKLGRGDSVSLRLGPGDPKLTTFNGVTLQFVAHLPRSLALGVSLLASGRRRLIGWPGLGL
jgi:hypothetical protein